MEKFKETMISSILDYIKENNIVGKLLSKWQRDGQTIYGDLNDWLMDSYNLSVEERHGVATMAIGDYVIHNPYCLQKVFVVTRESDIDGQILFETNVCGTMEIAKAFFMEEKRKVLTESYHFGGCNPDDFEVEDEETHFFINDPSDSYYEEITIKEKDILR